MSLDLGSCQYKGLSDQILELEEETKSYGYLPLEPEHISSSLSKHIEFCREMLIKDFEYDEENDKEVFDKLVKIKNYDQMFRFYRNNSWHLFDTINIIYFSLFPKPFPNINYSNESCCADQAFELKQRGVISSYKCLKGFDT